MRLRNCLLTVLLLSGFAFGQGSIYSSGGPSVSSSGVPIFSLVTVCTFAATGGFGVSCSPQAVVYPPGDIALTPPILTQPFATDNQGNYAFACTPGQYKVQLNVNGVLSQLYPVNCGGSGTGTGGVNSVLGTLNQITSSGGINPVLSLASPLILLGPLTSPGLGTFGSESVSGSSTLNGPATFGSSTNKVLKVLDATAYLGAPDIGAQITNAYASADCPAAGCHIKIPTGIYGALGTWTTPIAFSTAAKPAYLECDQGGQGIINAPTGTTQLIYSGTGAAITFNTGGGTGAGMSGCTLTGPSSGGSTQGLLVGGNFGTTEGTFSNNDISGFGVGIQFGSNTYVTSFHDNVVHDNGKEVYAPSSITGFGENITFTGGDFYNKAGAQANGIDLEEAGDYHFITNSFDEVFITIAAPALQLDLVSPHFENPVAATITDFLTMTSACTACRVSSMGGYWLEDGVSARTEFILDAAANSSVELFGGGFTAAETVPQLVRFTGANASFYGFGLSNFQALFTADSSGALESVSCSNTNFPSGCSANVFWSGVGFIGTGTGAEIASGTLSNTNLTGFCTFAGSITTCGPITFSGSHTNHPECEIQPQFDATAAGSIWPSYTGSTSMTINEHAYVAGSVSYHCDFKK